MSYASAGRSRSFGARPRFSRPQYGRPQFRGPQRSSINPSKYVNVAVELEKELPYQSTHTFEDFGLHPQVMENVRRHGYTTPTPIQDQAIPAMMQGKDVVGIANTGTGKTAAFLLPLVHKIANDKHQGLLVLAPTRELALQIQDELRQFSGGLGISMCLCIGGTNLERQVQTLKNDPHVVIGTPGRLKDLIQRGAFNTAMFTNIVLDEVDRMLDIGFLRDIRFLISHLPEVRQSAFFSATTTRETDEIMRAFLRNPVQISINSQVTSHHIHQDIVRVEPGEFKVDVLHKLLTQKEFEKVLIFGRTKHGIIKLEQQLAARGMRVSAIHGNKTQGARQRSLDLFKRGYVQALLATDIVARGIDIDDVTHVINYDEPQTYEDYVHRIGRTGRAGKIGKALTFLQ